MQLVSGRCKTEIKYTTKLKHVAMVITFVTVFVANVNMAVEDVTVVSIHVTLHTSNVSYTFRCKQPRAFQQWFMRLHISLGIAYIIYLIFYYTLLYLLYFYFILCRILLYIVFTISY